MKKVPEEELTMQTKARGAGAALRGTLEALGQ